jgi:hypothetical protein
MYGWVERQTKELMDIYVDRKTERQKDRKDRETTRKKSR